MTWLLIPLVWLLFGYVAGRYYRYKYRHRHAWAWWSLFGGPVGYFGACIDALCADGGASLFQAHGFHLIGQFFPVLNDLNLTERFFRR